MVRTSQSQSDRDLFLSCISDLRLYLHQRYGLPLKHPAMRSPKDLAGDGVAPNLSPAAVVQAAGPESLELARTLPQLRDVLGECRRCGLCAGRTQIVFGDGLATASLMIIGEAPGAEEDTQGKPFVGRSGQLLSKMLQALELSREQVYITNVVKCRPPQNRNPKSDEVSACAPFLARQIEIVRPKLLLALGTFAAQTLLNSDEPILRLRGKPYSYCGVPLIVTVHPAFCLYNPANKKYLWEDVKDIPDILSRMAAGHGGPIESRAGRDRDVGLGPRPADPA